MVFYEIRSLLLLPSIFPSIKVFSSESVLIRWPKYWSFSFSISPSNEYLGLISFRIDWFDLAVQGTLKSLLQFSICETTQKTCIRYYHLVTSAEDTREGSVPERPYRVLLGYLSWHLKLCFRSCYHHVLLIRVIVHCVYCMYTNVQF